jgi:hypothetical protein
MVHNGVLGTCVRPRYQRRGRHSLHLSSYDKSEAGHKNEQFSKGDDPHAGSIRATLIAFKMPYRLDALYLLPEILRFVILIIVALYYHLFL